MTLFLASEPSATGQPGKPLDLPKNEHRERRRRALAEVTAGRTSTATRGGKSARPRPGATPSRQRSRPERYGPARGRERRPARFHSTISNPPAARSRAFASPPWPPSPDGAARG